MCPASALPASAIEDFVVERISAASIDGTLAREIEVTQKRRIERRRETLRAVLADLPARIANTSAVASKLADELTKLEGRARALVEQREAELLDTAERQRTKAERELAELDEAETKWMLGALGDFGRVWRLMTPDNRGRLLRALVASVRVNEKTDICEVELVNFSADVNAEDAAA